MLEGLAFAFIFFRALLRGIFYSIVFLLTVECEILWVANDEHTAKRNRKHTKEDRVDRGGSIQNMVKKTVFKLKFPERQNQDNFSVKKSSNKN